MDALSRKLANLTYYRRSIMWCKYKYAQALSKNGMKPRKTVLFYPDMPLPWHLVYAVCHILGYAMTNDPDAHFDLIIAFQDTTFRSENKIFSALCRDQHVINARCGDISKERVDRIFFETFGYGLTIDPQTYNHAYIKKSNLNARHPVEAVEIFTAPTKPKEGFVYQKLIDNQTDKDSVTDIRTFIFTNTIPFTLYRKRSIHGRFYDDTVVATRVGTDEAFTKEEQAAIIRFCSAFGLDYGELDILRDNNDGKIYIVDVNNTTAGPQPGVHIKKKDYKAFLSELAGAFEKMAKQNA